MNGTIRILVGMLMVFGGVGGVEQSMELFPIYPTLMALFGLAIMASGAFAAARQEARENG